MQNFAKKSRLVLFTFAAGIAVGYFLFGWRTDSTPIATTAHAQTSVASAAAVWEYSTSSIDVPSLQAKLTVMGVDGWEVISVTATDALVDTGPDGKMHVLSQRV